LGVLRKVLDTRMNRFMGVSSLYLKNTATGQEVALDADVAFSGMGMLNVAILQEIYRKGGSTVDSATRRIITETVAFNNEASANQLLTRIGDGDALAGTRSLNGSLHNLGLLNTFLAAPYGTRDQIPPRVVTDANSRKDFNTGPDAYAQTTARDIGLLVGMLVQCSAGGGTLLAAYPDQITREDCRQAVQDLSLNPSPDGLAAGVPRGTRVVHRQGQATYVVGDAGAIWGPDGPYILSIFLYQRPTLDAAAAARTIKDLATITWDFFASSPAAVG
jgi:hypothetical protein